MTDRNKKHIIQIVSNKEWGGGEQYVYDLCKNLIVEGYPVSLFCRPIEKNVKRFSLLGTPLHRLPLKGSIDIISAFRLVHYLKQNECVIHCHNFKDAFTAAYARILSRNKNVRIVLTRHLVRKGKTSWLYRWLYRQINVLVFVSELAKKEFLSSEPKIDTNRLVVIPNSIYPSNLLSVVDVRKEFSIPKDCVLAMYHGRLAKEKGLDILIEAMQLLNNKKLYLILIGIGQDDYVDSLKLCVKKYNLENHVIFAGFRSPILSYLSACDFGVLPSVVRESSSLSCMEYMSRGRTVIATNNGGQVEYLNHGQNALLVPPNDAKALAESMSELFDNVSKRELLGQQALLDYAENLNYNRFLRQIEDVYVG